MLCSLRDCVVTPSPLAGEGGDEGMDDSLSSIQHPHLIPLPSRERKKSELRHSLLVRPLYGNESDGAGG